VHAPFILRWDEKSLERQRWQTGMKKPPQAR
jgi:hypothetical protein